MPHTEIQGQTEPLSDSSTHRERILKRRANAAQKQPIYKDSTNNEQRRTMCRTASSIQQSNTVQRPMADADSMTHRQRIRQRRVEAAQRKSNNEVPNSHKQHQRTRRTTSSQEQQRKTSSEEALQPHCSGPGVPLVSISALHIDESSNCFPFWMDHWKIRIWSNT